MLEAVSVAPPMTPTVPPVLYYIQDPSITISLGVSHLVATLRHFPLHMPLSFNKWLRCIPREPTDRYTKSPDPVLSGGHHRCHYFIDPQDEPQTVDTVIATPEDASSPPEAPTT
ncbi:hypothetical protein AAG906_027974 [Vitis piasezkii]